MTTFDTSFYNQNPLRSVQDYQNQYDQADIQKQNLQMNALALQSGTMDLQDRQRTLAEMNQVRNALAALGPNADVKARANAARLTGTIAGHQAADAMEKQAAELGSSQALAAKNNADAQSTQLKAAHEGIGYGIDSLRAANDPDAAKAALIRGAELHYYTPEVAQKLAAEVPSDPNVFAGWKLDKIKSGLAYKDTLPKLQTVVAGGVTYNQAVDPQTGKVTQTGVVQHTTSPDTIANNATSRANNAATNAVTMRGQNMTDARAKESSDNLGRPISMLDANGKPVTVQLDKAGNPHVMKDLSLNITHSIAGLSDGENQALFGPKGAVTEGRLDPNRINSRTAKLLAQAEITTPGTDFGKISGDIALGRNAGFRQKAMVAEVLPEIMKNMVDAGKKVGFNDNRTVGKMQAWIKGEFNDPDMTYYMTQRNDALMGIAGVMRGLGMTDQAHRAETEVASPTMNPAALDAWYQGQMKSLEPRLRINRKITRTSPDNPAPVPTSGTPAPSAAANAPKTIHFGDLK